MYQAPSKARAAQTQSKGDESSGSAPHAAATTLCYHSRTENWRETTSRTVFHSSSSPLRLHLFLATLPVPVCWFEYGRGVRGKCGRCGGGGARLRMMYTARRDVSMHHMHIHVHTHMGRMCAHIRTYTHTCAHTHAHAHSNTHIHTDTYSIYDRGGEEHRTMRCRVYTSIHTYIYVCTYIHIYSMYIYIHIHIDMYTYIYRCMYNAYVYMCVHAHPPIRTSICSHPFTPQRQQQRRQATSCITSNALHLMHYI